MVEVKLQISEDYIKILKARSSQKGFDSVEPYLEGVISQVASKIHQEVEAQGEQNGKGEREKNESEKSEINEDEERVKQRLAELGYLD